MFISCEKLRSLTYAVANIAQHAGEIILSHDPHRVAKSIKTDQSPVTEADLASHHFILSALEKLTPDIPALSEESTPETNTTIDDETIFWCIDPLDGTKGFINGLGEYTVNIALIKHGEPIIGVLYAPKFQTSYLAATFQTETVLAEVRHTDDTQTVITSPRLTPWRLTTSSLKTSERLQHCIRSNGYIVTSHAYSALKFGWIMAGAADLMIRERPTCSWDTAAGHCLMRALGGEIVDFNNQPLTYQYARKSQINPSFIAVADRRILEHFNWASLPESHHEQ